MSSFIDLITQNKLFDSHTHINDDSLLSNIQSIVERAEESNVQNIVDVSTDLVSLNKSLTLSKKYSNIYSTIGIHPEFCSNEKFNPVSEFNELTSLVSNKLIMVGETGLDYYWLRRELEEGKLTKLEMDTIISKQKELFSLHINYAKDKNLPLTIHSRDAVNASMDMVLGENVKAVFHSLTLETNQSERDFYNCINAILESENFVGINGIITYSSAENMRNVLSKVFKEKLKGKEPIDFYNLGFVFETDAPYLVPRKFSTQISGKNEPSAVSVIYEMVKNL